MGNGASKCEWRHAPEAHGGFWKSQWMELNPASGEDGWFLLARQSQVSGLVVDAARDGGQMKKPE